MQPPLLSIVAPVYNEAESLPHFLRRMAEVLGPLKIGYEIVLVDDGSRDRSWSIMKKAAASNGALRLLRFSRNFGKEAALAAGLDHAAGRAVIPIDTDLQDPPELIPEMLERWRKGADVVLAVRRWRNDDTFLKRTSANMFYRLFNGMSKVPLAPNAGDYRLLDRKVVEALKALPERTRFLKGLFAWVGFRQEVVLFDRPERVAGTTKWNYWRLWNYALEGIFSFSTMPLRVWTYLGMAIALPSFGFVLWILWQATVLGQTPPGYASLMVAITFLGSIQLIGLGLVGEYISRIFEETKRRPLYIIAETHEPKRRAR